VLPDYERLKQSDMSSESRLRLHRFDPAQGDTDPSRGYLLSARGLIKSYRQGAWPQRRRGLLGRALDLLGRLRDGQDGIEVPVLLGVDLDISPGEFVSIVGQSGSGKSTLLHLLGTLDDPDAGEIWFEGRRIDGLPAPERDRLRNHSFGFVFQFYHLLPELTVLENTLLPLYIRHGTKAAIRYRRMWRRRACEILDRVGLSHRVDHLPRQLSGGELQRTAIARALIGDPVLLFADEPTGNLDPATGDDVLDLLISLCREQGLSIIMVTHEQEIAARADRTLRLHAGQLVPVSSCPKQSRLDAPSLNPKISCGSEGRVATRGG